MDRFINKFLYMCLIICIAFLTLNGLYVIDFSDKTRNIFIFLTFILILLTSMKELFSQKHKFIKFLNGLALLCTITGGLFSITQGQLSMLIYICVIFSLINGIVVLTYSKT